MLCLDFDENVTGRDWIVGDIHGCFTRLENLLRRVGFDESKDRLFCCGDLGDRGIESRRALEWLEKKWFHTVRGNHEQMLIDAYTSQDDAMSACLVSNGGRWFFNLSQEQQAEFAFAYDCLPYMISIPCKGMKYGIVHADIPFSSWSKTKEVLYTEDNEGYSLVKNYLLWNRDRYNNDYRTRVTDLDLLFVGHTPVEETCVLGNIVYMDTGAVFLGKGYGNDKGFTLCNLTDYEFVTEIND